MVSVKQTDSEIFSDLLFPGTMGPETTPAVVELGLGSLYSLEKDGSTHKHLDKLDISNGLAWSADKRVMYFIDSIPRKIYAFDFDHQWRDNK